jgi:hypothetical protein
VFSDQLLSLVENKNKMINHVNNRNNRKYSKNSDIAISKLSLYTSKTDEGATDNKAVV